MNDTQIGTREKAIVAVSLIGVALLSTFLVVFFSDTTRHFSVEESNLIFRRATSTSYICPTKTFQANAYSPHATFPRSDAGIMMESCFPPDNPSFDTQYVWVVIQPQDFSTYLFDYLENATGFDILERDTRNAALILFENLEFSSRTWLNLVNIPETTVTKGGIYITEDKVVILFDATNIDESHLESASSIGLGVYRLQA